MLGRRKFRSSKARKREQKLFMVRSTAMSLFVVVVIALFVYGLQWDKIRIQQVAVRSEGVLTELELAAYLDTQLDDFFLSFIPQNSSLFVRTQALEENLIQAFPRIASATIKRAGLQTLSASVIERTPAALWCGDVVPPIAYKNSSDVQNGAEEAWGTCYLMDKDSFLYARAPFFTGNVFPRYYGSLESAEPIGQRFVTNEEFDHVQNFLLELQDVDLEPMALLFVDERDIELYLSNGLRVLAPRNEEFDLIKRRLVSTLESDTIDLSNSVEYLDLRFGTKAFVRYTEQKEAEEME